MLCHPLKKKERKTNHEKWKTFFDQISTLRNGNNFLRILLDVKLVCFDGFVYGEFV